MKGEEEKENKAKNQSFHVQFSQLQEGLIAFWEYIKRYDSTVPLK